MKALSYLKHNLPTLPTFKKHRAEPSPEQMAKAATKIASLDDVLQHSKKNSSILTKKETNDQGPYLEYVAMPYGPQQAIRLNGLAKYLRNIQRTDKDIRTTARHLRNHPDADVRAAAGSLLTHCKKHRGPLLHTDTLRNNVSDLKAKLDQAKEAEEERNAFANANQPPRERPLWETYFECPAQREADVVLIDPALLQSVPAAPQEPPFQLPASNTATQPRFESDFNDVQDSESVKHAKCYAPHFAAIDYHAAGYLAIALRDLQDQHPDAPPYFNKVTGEVSADPAARQAHRIDHAANYYDFAKLVFDIGIAHRNDDDGEIRDAAATLQRLAGPVHAQMTGHDDEVSFIPNSPELIAALLCIARRLEARYPFHLLGSGYKKEKLSYPGNYRGEHPAKFTPAKMAELKSRAWSNIVPLTALNYDNPTRQSAARMFMFLFAVRTDVQMPNAPLYYEKFADGRRALSYRPEGLTVKGEEHANRAAMQFAEMVREFGAEYSTHRNADVCKAAQVLVTISNNALSTQGGKESQCIIHNSQELENAFATIVQFGAV